MSCAFDVIFSGDFCWCILEIRGCRWVSISEIPSCEPGEWPLLWNGWKQNQPTNQWKWRKLSREGLCERLGSELETWVALMEGIQRAWCGYLTHICLSAASGTPCLKKCHYYDFYCQWMEIHVSTKKSRLPFLGVTLRVLLRHLQKQTVASACCGKVAT